MNEGLAHLETSFSPDDGRASLHKEVMIALHCTSSSSHHGKDVLVRLKYPDNTRLYTSPAAGNRVKKCCNKAREEANDPSIKALLSTFDCLLPGSAIAKSDFHKDNTM